MITYPTQKQWAKHFGAGLSAASSVIVVSPAVHDAVAVLSTVIEKVTGKTLANLAAEKSAELANVIASAFVKGTLPLIAGVTKQMAEAIGVVSSIVPIFAQGVAMGLAALAEQQAIQDENLKARTAAGFQYCKGRLETPKGTGPGFSVTPADMFRPVFEVLQAGKRPILARAPEYRIPLTVTSLICQLCGDESPLGWNEDKRIIWTPPGGYGDASGATVEEVRISDQGAQGYAQFLAIHHKRRGSLGIPQPVRRRMAIMIRSILASVRPRTLHETIQVGDQGRVLWPVLLDVLLQEWRKGRWDHQFLIDLQLSQIECWDVLNYQTGGRIAPVVDLPTGVWDLVAGWKYEIERAAVQFKPLYSYLSKPAQKKAFLLGGRDARKAIREEGQIDPMPQKTEAKALPIVAGTAATGAAALWLLGFL